MPSFSEAGPGQVADIASTGEWEAALSKPVVLVDFSATWCGPCKLISPEFERLAAEVKDVLFIKVDVDANEKVAADAGVSAMPTFQLYVNGKKEGELVGASKDKLAELVQQAAAAAGSAQKAAV